jgi:hypothetical protein
MTLIYQNAIGIDITVLGAFDITGYTSVVLKFKKPSGTILTKIPVVASPTAGTFTYETVAGDLDEVGEYTVSAVVTYPDGDVIKGELDKFRVYAPIV